MPTYEYRCKKGHRFEVVQGFSDDDVETCPKCGAAVERVYSAPAIHFKGKGFHNTDYGTRKRPLESASSSEGGGSSSEGGSSDSSESDSSSSSGDSGSSSGSDSSVKKIEKKDSKAGDKPAPKKNKD